MYDRNDWLTYLTRNSAAAMCRYVSDRSIVYVALAFTSAFNMRYTSVEMSAFWLCLEEIFRENHM
ncbi:hypothetical protein KSZ_48150 [Dictyobacter formicarum]|uniref:Uncharacterized protein n=1 Tax=Dictyobacter formicarum TaxID=2778368 RepID=A0ABQ3VM69_9CHLR|nr:hypothetical protein KSZ_48150 [Dictyobacter formicarum]